MAVKRVPERHQAAAIGLGTCQLHNLSRFDILLNFIMIRQDHLMGSPRNVEPIYICSIGTIRDGIPPGAQITKIQYRPSANDFFRINATDSCDLR
jgi:hypothetical protein